MAVLRVEEHGKVLKVILKPTKAFPIGYFYTDNNQLARDLVDSRNWCLYRNNKNIYVSSRSGTTSTGTISIRFHSEYAKRVLGYYPDYIDHVDGVEIDNRDCNLNVVNHQQNIRNKPAACYYYDPRFKLFQPRYTINKRDYKGKGVKTEFEVIKAVYSLHMQVYSDYNYDFFKDRRGDLDILDAELTEKITSDYATFLHVKRYVEQNPWYVYRYGLEDYCRQHNIIIPNFSNDLEGFMINPTTGQRLCPY